MNYCPLHHHMHITKLCFDVSCSERSKQMCVVCQVTGTHKGHEHIQLEDFNFKQKHIRSLIDKKVQKRCIKRELLLIKQRFNQRFKAFKKHMISAIDESQLSPTNYQAIQPEALQGAVPPEVSSYLAKLNSPKFTEIFPKPLLYQELNSQIAHFKAQIKRFGLVAPAIA